MVEDELENFTVSAKEIRIFKYQFIMNYMSKPTTAEKINFITKIYLMNPNWKDTVIKELIPTLKVREKKWKTIHEGNETKQVHRESKFMMEENKILNQMLSGEYRFNQMENDDKKLT